MKVGNVILGIFFWICIPGVFVISAIFGGLTEIAGGNGSICMIIPFVFFVIGLVCFITAREKKVHKEYEDEEDDEDKDGGLEIVHVHCPQCKSIYETYKHPYDETRVRCPYCGEEGII